MLAPFARFAGIVAFTFAAVGVAAGATPAKISFDLPADSAEKSLRLFSRQSGLEVVFASAVAKGVRTQAVKGEMPAREALAAMLAGSGLVVYEDKSGAVSIQRETTGPNAPRAAPTTTSDRPGKSRDNDPIANGDKPIELSPFTVSSTSDVGYLARNTLLGTRLDTSLNDVASQISVMTPEFLQDVAATSLEDAFRYSMNVDTFDDFSSTTAGGGGMDPSVYNDGQRFRTRGLGQSSLMQDLFRTSVRSDVYNTERFTLVSGPNAILFGLGSPAGIAETSLKRAHTTGRVKAELGLRVDSENSVRATFDLNVPILKDRLAARLVVLRGDENRLPAPSSQFDKRIFGTVTFQPFAHTLLRVSYEDVDMDAYPAKPIVVRDAITPWLAAGKPLFDNSGITPASAATVTNNRITAAGRANVFARYANATFAFPVGQTQGGVVGNPMSWVGTVSTRGPEFSRSAPDNQVGSLLDSTVFPLDVNYGGNGQRNLTSAWTTRAILEQNFFDKVFLQAGYNTEKWLERVASAQIGVATLGADANMYLPDGVTRNPNVGRYYFQNTGRWRFSRSLRDREDWRLSLATVLDLEKKNKWLGRHRVMGLATREQSISGGQQSYNVRPVTVSPTAAAAGLRAGLPGNLNVGDIPPRVYVDDPRDPNSRGIYWINLPFDQNQPYTLPDGTTIAGWDHPTGSTGGGGNKNRTDSQVLAVQDYWLGGRIVTTLGWRKDRDRSVNYNPVFGTFLPPIEQITFPDYTTDNRGGTRNLGIVAHPFKWLSFHFGKSRTFAPGIQAQDPYGNAVPGAHGEGRDYGFSLRPLGERINLRVNFYENTSGPAQSSFHSAVYTPIQDIEASLTRAGVPPHPTFQPFAENANLAYRVMSNLSSKGLEVELAGNPMPNWRLAVSVAKATAEESDIGLPWIALVKEESLRWARNGNLPVWNNESLAVKDKFQPLVNALNLMQASDGTKVESAREWRVRATTRYSFREGWLKNAFLGASYLWSSANVVGYRQSVVSNAYPNLGIGGTISVSDITRPYEGNPLTAIDAFAGYSRRLLRGKIGWRGQLNVRNLLDKRDPLIRDVFSDGSVRQFNLPQPRLFILTNTFSY
ncbi:MAG: hypothetical protein Q7S40_17100 [Opitutaceae bacterium]|nr:hypothetical protein [Opitutaceae bacterium]